MSVFARALKQAPLSELLSLLESIDAELGAFSDDAELGSHTGDRPTKSEVIQSMLSWADKALELKQ